MRQHDGEDDEEGERIECADKSHDYRRYIVDAGQLIKVSSRQFACEFIESSRNIVLHHSCITQVDAHTKVSPLATTMDHFLNCQAFS